MGELKGHRQALRTVSPEQSLAPSGREFFLRLLDEARRRKDRVLMNACSIAVREVLPEIFERGFGRERIQFTDSHHIVTYPPSRVWEPMKQEEIFGESKEGGREVALYIHIPFCTGKCLYCHYVSWLPKSKEEMEKYIGYLVKELGMLSRLLQNRVIRSVYFGGGTPFVLLLDLMQRVNSAIFSLFNIAKGAEVTWEASPETVLGEGGKEKLEWLPKNSANRLSMGVQTLCGHILEFVLRRHTGQQAIDALKLAREYFENINLDFMIGLPLQTVEDWKRDVEALAQLKPPSITTYPVGIQEVSGIYRLYLEKRELFPSFEAELLMKIMANEELSRLGYSENPAMWHTLSEEYFNKNQLHKWGGEGEMVGVGVSAYSYCNGIQYGNTKNLREYHAGIEEGRLPLNAGIRLSEEERLRRRFVFGIRLLPHGVDKEELKREFGIAPEGLVRKEIEGLKSLGLIEEDGPSLRLTYAGRLFSLGVCREFFSGFVKERCGL